MKRTRTTVVLRSNDNIGDWTLAADTCRAGTEHMTICLKDTMMKHPGNC